MYILSIITQISNMCISTSNIAQQGNEFLDKLRSLDVVNQVVPSGVPKFDFRREMLQLVYIPIAKRAKINRRELSPVNRSVKTVEMNDDAL
jgi:hypothetical protein